MTNHIGQQFGNYRLIGLLGRGGFADVYLGEHIYLKIQAAIKILHTQLEGEDLKDFLQEAQTIARLRHPHIIRILDFGVDHTENTPYLVMDLASNGTLRQRHPKGSTLSLVTIVSYVKQVASALQYAHDEKLIHCDVKPENMLLGSNEEVLLSDFGIAALAHSTSSLKTQKYSGTVHYSAPEQIQGKPRPASDQYALGIVIYEWLTGSRPFSGSSHIEIAMQHISTLPPPLHAKLSKISPVVEQIVMMALEKDPKQRFPSVQQFATALEQASQPESSSKAATPVGTLLLTYRDHFRGASAAVWSPDGMCVASASGDCTVQVWNARTGKTLVHYQGHGGPAPIEEMGSSMDDLLRPIAVAWSPDGTRVVSGSWGGSVQVWDATTGTDVLTYHGHHLKIKAVAWSPDGTRIASGSDDGIQVWDAITAAHITTYAGHNYEFDDLAWSPDSKYISSISQNKKSVRVWDATTGSQILAHGCYPDPAYQTGRVAWSPDGKLIASGNQRGVEVWEVETETTVFTCNRFSSWRQPIAWSPDSKHIALTDNDRTIQLWDVTTGSKVYSYSEHSDSVSTIAWSPDGRYIVSGDGQETLVWDAMIGKTLLSYHGHLGFANTLAWSPDGESLVSHSSGSNKVQVWDATTGTTRVIHRGYWAAWSPDSKRLVSNCEGGIIEIWDAVTGATILTYQSGGAVAWSPDGKYIASGDFENNEVQIWDAATGVRIFTYTGHSARVSEVVWSPDGKFIASSSIGTVHVWDASMGAVQAICDDSSWVRALAWSPDSTCIVLAREEMVQVWEVTTTEHLMFTYRGHSSWVNALAWSPDGTCIASASDETVQVWETATRRPSFIYKGHSWGVTTLAWSPDGTCIASASADNTVQIWQAVNKWHMPRVATEEVGGIVVLSVCFPRKNMVTPYKLINMF